MPSPQRWLWCWECNGCRFLPGQHSQPGLQDESFFQQGVFQTSEITFTYQIWTNYNPNIFQIFQFIFTFQICCDLDRAQISFANFSSFLSLSYHTRIHVMLDVKLCFLVSWSGSKSGSVLNVLKRRLYGICDFLEKIPISKMKSLISGFSKEVYLLPGPISSTIMVSRIWFLSDSCREHFSDTRPPPVLLPFVLCSSVIPWKI